MSGVRRGKDAPLHDLAESFGKIASAFDGAGRAFESVRSSMSHLSGSMRSLMERVRCPACGQDVTVFPPGRESRALVLHARGRQDAAHSVLEVTES